MNCYDFLNDNQENNKIVYFNYFYDKCRGCLSTDLRFNGEYFVCIDCGICSTKSFFQEPNYIDKLNFRTKYNRVKHFNKILRSITGDAVASVPRDVIKLISKYSFNTIFELKKIMKELKYKKYYLSSYYIFRNIKGYDLITLDMNTKDRLLHHFKAIDSTFIKLREKYDNNRINTFHYHYIIRKLFTMLGISHFNKHLSLMKSKTKLRYSERLFKMICDELDYEFVEEVY